MPAHRHSQQAYPTLQEGHKNSSNSLIHDDRNPHWFKHSWVFANFIACLHNVLSASASILYSIWPENMLQVVVSVGRCTWEMPFAMAARLSPPDCTM